jgi:glycosyltransferase involved in cell wall biosynthesis
VSKAAEETLKGMPEFARTPVGYLPYGVPMPEKTVPSRSESGAALRILYLGRLDQEQKRVRLFPQILEQLKSAGIPFHWTVAGEGPERSFLQSAMQSPSPTQTVSFSGTVRYQEVPQVLAAHDVFLLASDYEGLPLSLLEAMGYGLIPVVSDLTSGIREVVDEAIGKRVAPDNTPGYGEAIIWLHQHREEMSRLSQNAQAKVRRDFSIRAMTDRWLNVLPSPPALNVNWPAGWHVRAPLGSRGGIRFSLPGRFLRRWLFKLRSGGFMVALG